MSRRSALQATPYRDEQPQPATPTVVTSSPRLDRGQCPKCFVRYGRAMPAHVAAKCDGDASKRPGGIEPTPQINNGQPISTRDLSLAA